MYYGFYTFEGIIVHVQVLQRFPYPGNHSSQVLQVTHLFNLLDLGKEIIEVELVFGYFFLIILQKENLRSKLNHTIYDLNSQIKHQQQLAPILVDLLKRTKLQVQKGLTIPEQGRIARDDTDKVPILFRDIARKSGLNLKRFRLDLKSFEANSGFLEVNMVLHGRVSRFQRFLKRLYEVSYVKKIERIIIRTLKGKNFNELELYVTLIRE